MNTQFFFSPPKVILFTIISLAIIPAGASIIYYGYQKHEVALYAVVAAVVLADAVVLAPRAIRWMNYWLDKKPALLFTPDTLVDNINNRRVSWKDIGDITEEIDISIDNDGATTRYITFYRKDFNSYVRIDTRLVIGDRLDIIRVMKAFRDNSLRP